MFVQTFISRHYVFSNFLRHFIYSLIRKMAQLVLCVLDIVCIDTWGWLTLLQQTKDKLRFFVDKRVDTNTVLNVYSIFSFFFIWTMK